MTRIFSILDFGMREAGVKGEKTVTTDSRLDRERRKRNEGLARREVRKGERSERGEESAQKRIVGARAALSPSNTHETTPMFFATLGCVMRGGGRKGGKADKAWGGERSIYPCAPS